MYCVIWEFLAKSGKETAFERAYGPEGDWAGLFRRSDGFLGLSIHRDVILPRRYVVIDRWTTPDAYDAFKARYGVEYDALDQECTALTDREAPLGSFVTASDVTS